MSSSPVQIGSLLDGLATRYRWQKRLSRNTIWQQWPEIAGEAIAKHSWPMKFKERDVLVVAVSDSVWMQQLSLQKLMLLEAINRTLPPESMVRDLHFTMENIDQVRKSHAATTSAPKTNSETLYIQPKNIPESEKQDIDQHAKAVTEPVEDEELKAVLQRAYIKSRIRQLADGSKN